MYQNEFVIQERVKSFIYLVYGWMALALSATAAVAYYVSTRPAIYQYIFSSSWSLIGLFVAQIALVMILSFFLMRMSYATAIALFMLYAASLGLTLSTIFMVYKIGSIYTTFGVTAGTFGVMCLYGYFTKTDLTGLSNILTMAVFGLILGMVINMFLQNAMMDYIISAIGVILFTVLTAVDTQKIKKLGEQLLGDEETSSKVAVLGALTLYLDFINLFLFLLNFLGEKRDR